MTQVVQLADGSQVGILKINELQLNVTHSNTRVHVNIKEGETWRPMSRGEGSTTIQTVVKDDNGDVEVPFKVQGA